MIDNKPYEWVACGSLASKTFICSNCSEKGAHNKGYYSQKANGGQGGKIYICHSCHYPNFFSNTNVQSPSHPHGKEIKEIDSIDITTLYNEARSAFSANAYTASAMCCRKLLMNIAVSKGLQKIKTLSTMFNI